MPYIGQSVIGVEHPATSALTATTGTFSGDVTVDTSTLKVDSTNNRVGIGTASPSFAISAVGGSRYQFSPNNTSGGGLAIQEVDSSTVGLHGINHDNNAYKGISLFTGANAALTIDANGIINNPLQPAFSVSPSSLISNLAINSYTTISFGTEHYDVGGNFASNTFTAPVTGKYQLSFQLYTLANDEDAAYTYWSINTSNREYFIIFDSGAFDQEIETWTPSLSILADMDSNDTAYMRFYQSGGTAQVDLSTASYFTGVLIS